eukprot:contig_14363_g3450
MVWDLWDKVRRTLNRADTIDEEEIKAFRSNTTALVTWLKNKFPWFNVSPKMRILLYHAPDFLERFGSLGLYGEQAIEAWHGHYNQNANQYTAKTELQSAAKLVR